MRIQVQSSSVRLRLAGWFTLALFVLPCVAQAEDRVEPEHAASHHHHAGQRHRKAPSSVAQERQIAACVHERTGPTGGVPAREALKLCTKIARDHAKHAKAKARAAKAIEVCREDVFVACEDATERDHDDGECSAEALQAELAECITTEGN